MSIKDGTCEFQLTRGVNYKSQGSTELAETVTLKEPGMDHIKFYMKLKQMIMRSQMELAKQASEINKLKNTIGEEVKSLNQEADSIESET